ncbi:unnamed protein product [Cylindrotheca closterium]|uniref:Uncharacterized protein n=1 Tax=Cylindrotheca closterium TaxID=2856 RepID=A0AAD2G6P7_9STRA|nr:unnamed protein product [Cylindrotheca closterium]
MTLSRDELIEKIGGENQYNFLVTSFCENIQQDIGLKDIFMSFDLELLADRMTALLDIVLSQTSDSETLDDKDSNKVILANFSLFEAGMNATHFKLLQANFESALHDAWVDEDVIQQCTQRFAKLRTVFEEEGAAMEKSDMAGRVMEVRMMVAKSA